ncbi:uncharacterized protein LOC142022888 isoform X2 [Carettochelys insculpta]|uniref:uncharacterized protein LOC142022888 isoform X2 n=1 Tax=Carettochelys insculpta TaxID=44489 RepID=UPI003EBD22AA
MEGQSHSAPASPLPQNSPRVLVLVLAAGPSPGPGLTPQLAISASWAHECVSRPPAAAQSGKVPGHQQAGTAVTLGLSIQCLVHVSSSPAPCRGCHPDSQGKTKAKIRQMEKEAKELFRAYALKATVLPERYELTFVPCPQPASPSLLLLGSTLLTALRPRSSHWFMLLNMRVVCRALTVESLVQGLEQRPHGSALSALSQVTHKLVLAQRMVTRPSVVLAALLWTLSTSFLQCGAQNWTRRCS